MPDRADASGPLPVDEIDLESLVLARNDAHPAGDWWFDPRTGSSLYFGVDDDTDLPDLIEGVHVLVPAEPQPDGDVDDFLVELAEAADRDEVDGEVVARLYRAFHRRGGGRRFRELVADSAVAERWQRFAMRREVGRAIDWLLGRDLVERESAERLLGELRDGTT